MSRVQLFRRAFAVSALALVAAVGPLVAESRASSADACAPRVASFLEGLGARPGATRNLNTSEVLAFMGVGARLGLNVFELLDDAYRWAIAANVRLRFAPEGLREATRAYDIGRERVRSLLPMDLLTSLEVGAALSPTQPALAATLAEPYSEFVEIGTIKLAVSFGFGALEPERFLNPYGISVARFPISASLDRLELYAPHKGAIYINGVSKPKRWNLWPIASK